MSEAGTTPAAMRYGHGFQVPPEEYLDYPPGKLPVALEGSDPYGRRAGEPCRLQQGHKLNRDHAEHEPVERHDERKENDPDDAHASFEHGTVWRRRRRRRWIRGVLRRIAARESEPVQRQTDREVDGGEGDQRAALAIGFVQVVADDPEHGRGVRTVEGEVGDCLPSSRRRHLHQCGKRRVRGSIACRRRAQPRRQGSSPGSTPATAPRAPPKR
jgi:hypothetical protein